MAARLAALKALSPPVEATRSPRADETARAQVGFLNVLARQLSFLPDGPMGPFAKVQLTAEGVPSEVIDLWRRFQANEIDPMDFAEALKTLKRQASSTKSAWSVVATP